MLLLALGGTALGQSGVLERCATLESDAARLACYDEAMRETSPRRPSAEEAAPDAPAASGGAAAPASGTAPVSTAPAAPAAPAVNAGGTEAVPSAAERRPATVPDAAEPRTQEPKKNYEAVVTAMYERPLGQVVVTLDNGERWSEQYASRAFHVEVGDTVTMKKSRFSSAYRLVSPSGRAYAMTRFD